MILRCTGRVLALLGGHAVTLTEPPPSDDDWYLNLLWVDRQKCLLLTHAGTLFSVFVAGVRKADLRPIGPYVVKVVEAELRSEHLPPDALGRLHPDAVRLAKTASRSILGFMNDIAVHCRYQVADAGDLDSKVCKRRARPEPHPPTPSRTVAVPANCDTPGRALERGPPLSRLSSA